MIDMVNVFDWATFRAAENERMGRIRDAQDFRDYRWTDLQLRIDNDSRARGHEPERAL